MAQKNGYFDALEWPLCWLYRRIRGSAGNAIQGRFAAAHDRDICIDRSPN